MIPKPSNVPSDAVRVPQIYGEAWWQRCSYSQKDDADRCQVFNNGGGTIINGVFLPYDGGEAAKQPELEIDGNARLAGPYIVCLKNGRILIPQSDFQNQRRFIDFATGRSKTR
jgi:hypothetical protein